MTRTTHKAHATPAFPVYCLDWADDETLILGGGGGASRSGITNMLKLCKVSHDGQKVDYINELKLSNEEDAPMTLAVDRKGKNLVTGINESETSIKGGKNDHTRLYSYGDNELAHVRGQKTIEAEWTDDYPYQKLTSLAPGHDLMAVGTTDNRVAVLHYPSLEPAVPVLQHKSEVVDLDWGGEDGRWLVVVTTDSLLLYHLTGEKLAAHLKQSIYPPSIDIAPVSFRSARFSPGTSSTPTIHAVLNASKAPAKRGAPRKAFVANFTLVAGPSKTAHTAEEEKSAPVASTKGKEKEVVEEEEELGRWDVVLRREVATKPVTVFDISSDGTLLAYGCSDLSIGILDAKTLAPLLKILAAHSFPPTALKFNPSANLLVSASADNTIRAIVVPPSFAGVSMILIAFIIAILMLLIALYLRR